MIDYVTSRHTRRRGRDDVDGDAIVSGAMGCARARVDGAKRGGETAARR